MTWQEAIDGFRALLGVCDEAGVEPLEARIWIPAPPDRYGIHIRLGEEGESDPDSVTRVTLLLDKVEEKGKELGFHVRRSMFFILLTA